MLPIAHNHISFRVVRTPPTEERVNQSHLETSLLLGTLRARDVGSAGYAWLLPLHQFRVKGRKEEEKKREKKSKRRREKNINWYVIIFLVYIKKKFFYVVPLTTSNLGRNLAVSGPEGDAGRGTAAFSAVCNFYSGGAVFVRLLQLLELCFVGCISTWIFI